MLDSIPEQGRVVLVRLRSLGDCVLTTPAIEILHQHRPDLQIGVVVEPRFAGVFEGNPAVHWLLPPRVSAVRRWRPHLCLNLHGGPASAVLTACSGARVRAGFAHFQHQFLYGVKIPRAQEILNVERKVHTAEHLASAIFYLGAPRVEIPRARLFTTAPKRGGSYAVIHPMASEPAKTWPRQKFLAVADHLRHAAGLESIFIGGPGEDLSVFHPFQTVTGASLSEIKVLLRDATLFIGNDSGPAHMAAAFGLPVVVLFGPSDPTIWAPWRTHCEVLAEPGGITFVEVATVLAAVERLGVPA